MECSMHERAYGRNLLLSVLLFAPGVASAADNGFYVGLASSEVESDYEIGPAASGGPEDDRGFKGIVGFRPLDSFAIEANYVDLGETVVPVAVACITTPCPTEASIDSQAVSVSAVGLFTFPAVDLFARVGYARWQSELAPFATQEREGTDPTYGAGAQVRVGSFALRLEYERFNFDDDAADLVSVGFTYTFL
jgi:OmpA-OmpF porin, OOP family